MNWRPRGTRTGFLQLAGLLVVAVIGLRLVHLQVILHDELHKRAQLQWETREVLDPKRGNIYDARDRALALSISTWRVGIAASLVDDANAVAATVAPALGMSEEQIAGKIRNARGSHIVLRKDQVLGSDELVLLKGQRAVTLERLQNRLYPFDGVGASLIGFHRQTREGGSLNTGLEKGLDDRLVGTAGEAIRFEAARPGESMGYRVLQRPRNGHDVYLTADAGLQAICEEKLATAIADCGAKGGVVLVANPANGDILAAASWPLVADRGVSQHDPAVWQNFNFSGQYEPGSVFKIFTAAALLEHAAIDTATIFDCDDGDFGSFTIRNADSHSGGLLSFNLAFVYSSNVYFARAVANLRHEEFHRELVDFGFGVRARLPYPIAARGILHSPEKWSGRSRPTIAIGQEVAVTPLQLVMAGCAIANGGYLYAPRIVRQTRDRDSGSVEEHDPTPLRRVISDRLARHLRTVMRQVVDEGTGCNAALPWIDIAGKTGTAEKCKDGRGYEPGAYMSSFLGLVPADQPRLVMLTMLDEPDWAHHYAAQSAAPLFREIITEMRRSTDWLTGCEHGGRHTVASRAACRTERVPDVLWLNAIDATERLRRAGFEVVADGAEGTVVETVPGPGARMERGGRVTVTVAGSGDAQAACPDLAGLSTREVTTLAARLGLRVKLQGEGYVVAQRPAAGAPVGTDPVALTMEPTWQ